MNHHQPLSCRNIFDGFERDLAPKIVKNQSLILCPRESPIQDHHLPGFQQRVGPQLDSLDTVTISGKVDRDQSYEVEFQQVVDDKNEDDETFEPRSKYGYQQPQKQHEEPAQEAPTLFDSKTFMDHIRNTKEITKDANDLTFLPMAVFESEVEEEEEKNRITVRWWSDMNYCKGISRMIKSEGDDDDSRATNSKFRCEYKVMSMPAQVFPNIKLKRGIILEDEQEDFSKDLELQKVKIASKKSLFDRVETASIESKRKPEPKSLSNECSNVTTENISQSSTFSNSEPELPASSGVSLELTHRDKALSVQPTKVSSLRSYTSESKRTMSDFDAIHQNIQNSKKDRKDFSKEAGKKTIMQKWLETQTYFIKRNSQRFHKLLKSNPRKAED